MDWVQYPNGDIRGPIVLIEVGFEFSIFVLILMINYSIKRYKSVTLS